VKGSTAALQPANESFLAGGGELGHLLRSHDWASTPLGSPDAWPQSLKLSIRIMLTSRQPIWIGWGDELIYFYNDPYKAIIGGKHPWAIGMPTREVWREIWTDISPMLDTAMSGDLGTYVEAQLLIMHRNGYPEETYYTFSYSPIPNDDGSVGGIFCANSDDTQRVIGERQLALLRELAAETATARSPTEACQSAAAALSTDARDAPCAMIYVADPDAGGYDLVAASGILPGAPGAPQKISFDDAGAWPIHEVSMEGRLRVVEHIDELTEGAELPRGPWESPPSRAAIIPIQSTGQNVRPGALVVGLNPYRQIDDNYRGFLSLAAGQIAAAIANAQAYEEERRRSEALAELDRAKTAFFSNVSHEFRTPLTLMLAPIEDTLNDVESPLLERHRERIEVAHRNSARLLKLVNSLLDFSRIEAGRIDASFEPIDLAQFTALLASNFRSAIERAGLAFEVNCAPLSGRSYVDRDMWEKIVFNLLSNAFKFTFEGSIVVELRDNDRCDAAELVVTDTGVGIPAEELPRLFERFHRVEGQRSRSFEGTGIGLALVQELVRLHGGTVHVDGGLGQGTRFTVSIPFGAAHLPADKVEARHSRAQTSVRAEAYVEEMLRWLPDIEIAQSARDTADSSALLFPEADREHVVVADDNADMRRHISRLLNGRWNVTTAPNGKAALDLIRERKPDLVLTDVMMPELDGFGLIRQVRSDPDLREIPIIMLSARAGEEARLEGLESGADDYLTKPFSGRELLARVNANLQLARLRREATRDLRESEERFRNMADNAPIMMWMNDADGACTYFNRGWYEFTGMTPDRALGYGAFDVLHPEDTERAKADFFNSIRNRQPLRVENRVRRADGAWRWVLGAGSPRFDGEGEFRGFIGSLVDITEHKEAERVLQRANADLEKAVAVAVAERAAAEAQLHHAQKMEAVGRLTGGVAHDFNNVLQIIGGSLQLLAREVAGNLRAETRLQTAVAGVARGSRLASQLLAFGRRQPLAPKVVNLGRMLRSIDEMLRRALGESIEIETIVAGGLWNALVDPAQVENVLLNLAINARDAMQGRGKLTIELGNASLDDAYVANWPDVKSGQYVMLAVTDTGCGIPPDIMEQVFEPFFTTKSEGRGTGLGLSMTYGFVKQSGGHVKIYSEVGIGTTVRIYLPRVRQLEDAETVADSGPLTGGSETILVAEDDEDVRVTVADMLSELGYKVLKAKDADAALAIVESGVAIDLLFTDVVMPGGLRSPDLARKACERLPGLKVLFTSGYTDNAIVHGGRLDEGVELLSKPYTKESLARKLRQIMGQSVEGKPTPPPKSPEAVVQPEPRGRSVLLVEDEPMIRMAAEDMLVSRGHRVASAHDAADALRQFNGGEAFDVVIADLGLPGIGGHQLAAQLLAVQPSLSIIFATGTDRLPPDTDEAVVARATILLKPYDEADIDRAIARAVQR
jgi:PAS domain S-box-containing protein